MNKQMFVNQSIRVIAQTNYYYKKKPFYVSRNLHQTEYLVPTQVLRLL